MRQGIFSRERLVPIDESLCANFVPKLGSLTEKKAYERLRAIEGASLTSFASSFSRRTLDDLVRDHADDLTSISIGGTAYNFINAFFSTDLAKVAVDSGRLSSSPNVFVSFVDEATAHAAFALLTSRIAFWLWRVEADGFHVTSDFLSKLPLWWLLSDRQIRDELAEHGRSLRRASIASTLRSVNSGRETFSFGCGRNLASSHAIEQVVLAQLFGSTDFSTELDRVLHDVTSIDGKTRRATTNGTLA
jgi:hypothetical protein